MVEEFTVEAGGEGFLLVLNVEEVGPEELDGFQGAGDVVGVGFLEEGLDEDGEKALVLEEGDVGVFESVRVLCHPPSLHLVKEGPH